jgi:hypothetical protein
MAAGRQKTPAGKMPDAPEKIPTSGKDAAKFPREGDDSWKESYGY